MQRKIMLLAAMAMMAVSAVGTERIAVDDVINHYPWDGKVDCVTTFSGLEAGYAYKVLFTISVRQGGETIRKVVTNDFNKANGTYTNTFDCTALFGAGFYPNGGIVVDLVKRNDRTGTPIGITGDVLVINVASGSSATKYLTTEYENVDIGTFNCVAYKTDKIVLRKIPAGAYYCQPGTSWLKTVTNKYTTAGFYIGIFQVTQRQCELVTGETWSYTYPDDPGDDLEQRPVNGATWYMIRGHGAIGTAVTESSEDSFLQRLVARTGLSGFDLPTEAQWEIAARANTTSAYGSYWNGTSEVAVTTSNFDEVAWYAENAGITKVVGSKRPNLFGLYDVQGNVWEWCRDGYSEKNHDPANVDTPCTAESRDREMRGGDCESFYTDRELSLSYRGSLNGYYGRGFRLMKDCP